jgi:hypothetical protein
MDLYAKNEAACKQLHDEIVADIRTVLEEKGYTYGQASHYDKFEPIPGDSALIINGSHTDHITVDNLLKHLRDAYHVLPKMD